MSSVFFSLDSSLTPATNHTPDAAARAEYDKYAQQALRLFAKIVGAPSDVW